MQGHPQENSFEMFMQLVENEGRSKALTQIIESFLGSFDFYKQLITHPSAKGNILIDKLSLHTDLPKKCIDELYFVYAFYKTLNESNLESLASLKKNFLEEFGKEGLNPIACQVVVSLIEDKLNVANISTELKSKLLDLKEAVESFRNNEVRFPSSTALTTKILSKAAAPISKDQTFAPISKDQTLSLLLQKELRQVGIDNSHPDFNRHLTHLHKLMKERKKIEAADYLYGLSQSIPYPLDDEELEDEMLKQAIQLSLQQQDQEKQEESIDNEVEDEELQAAIRLSKS